MLLFITAPGHTYTVKSLVERAFGAEVPTCQVTTYDDLFHSPNTLRATHIFTDFERLYDWELILAADLYSSIRYAGLPCLNNPAKALCRYELLRKLHAAGINPNKRGSKCAALNPSIKRLAVRVLKTGCGKFRRPGGRPSGATRSWGNTSARGLL